MVSIPVHGGPTPHDAARDAVEWGRVVVATLARGVVATLLGLALWAAAPAVIGWHPTTVMTGSMEPRLRPGDVVVSRPVPAAELRLGQVLLADDPDQPGHLRMHRAVATGPQGTIVTRGDANPQRDSTPVDRSAVHGVAFLRIPLVATPIVWMRSGEWAKVGLVALAVAVALWLCTVDGSLRRLVETASDDEDTPGDGPPDGLEARPTPVPPVASDRRSGRHVLSRHVLSRHAVGSRRADRYRARRVRRLRRGGAAAVVVVIAGTIGLLLPAQAVADPFKQATVNPTSSFGAGTAVAATTLVCTPNADKSVTISFAYPSSTPANSFDVVVGNTVVGSSVGAAQTVRVVGQSILSLGIPVNVQVRTNLGGTWTALSTTIAVRTSLLSTDLSC